MTNFEKIKQMSVEELALLICGIYDDDICKYDKFICGTTIPNYDELTVKEWLEREADNG